MPRILIRETAMAPRVTSAKEIFAAMSNRFLPEQAGDLTATILFDLTGEGGGQWSLSVANGQATVAEGALPNPTLTLSAAASDYVSIINGDLSPMQAFMQGKVKVTGDASLAIKMQSWFARD
jgi:putative sterol carrier protein